MYHRLEDAQAITAALKGLDMSPQLLEAKTPTVAIPPALSPRLKAMLAVSGIGATGA